MAVYIGKDQPTGWVVMHYGVKGMRWRHRKGQISGNNADRVRELLAERSARRRGKMAIEDRWKHDIKSDWGKTFANNSGRVPGYTNPIKDRDQNRWRAEMEEDGRFNRFDRTVRGRGEQNESRVRGKLAEKTINDAYKEIDREYGSYNVMNPETGKRELYDRDGNYMSGRPTNNKRAQNKRARRKRRP